jgi:DNA-directed RNA polymerase specialized sigma24 family protein
MENVVTHEEDWKVCFAELGPGLVLFARQFVRQLPDAEDIVQEAFVKFWRKQHSIENRGLLYATVRLVALDLLRRDARVSVLRAMKVTLQIRQNLCARFHAVLFAGAAAAYANFLSSALAHCAL